MISNQMLALVLSVMWIAPHIMGYIEYSLGSVVFPLLWYFIQSHFLDAVSEKAE